MVWMPKDGKCACESAEGWTVAFGRELQANAALMLQQDDAEQSRALTGQNAG